MKIKSSRQNCAGHAGQRHGQTHISIACASDGAKNVYMSPVVPTDIENLNQILSTQTPTYQHKIKPQLTEFKAHPSIAACVGGAVQSHLRTPVIIIDWNLDFYQYPKLKVII